jgi:diaminohydroxyphosphoribosylaminopyrimidine deaminase / 5-amino-6-(5-phosphoribosylamino)uracil reductase
MTGSFTDKDLQFMAKAFGLAEQAKGHTFPNPAVGAVIIQKSRIVGLGKTACCGGDHAEIAAIKKAGKRAAGATMYVTLEPCCHHGKTPPCTDAIIKSGIKRVVASMMDPNPLVAGKGIQKLRQNGIKAETGLLKTDAYALNEDFCWAIVKKRPWITLKLAITLDGRIADSKGDSQWITSHDARAFAHLLRSRHAGIIIGAGTLKKDNPLLTVRLVKGANPARFVFSSTPRLNAGLAFIKTARKTKSVIICPNGKNGDKRTQANGVEIWYTGKPVGAAMIKAFLKMAYAQGITSLLVEGGSKIASLMLENRLVNRIYLAYGNKILGSGLNALNFSKQLPISKALELAHAKYRILGPDFIITGIPKY